MGRGLISEAALRNRNSSFVACCSAPTAGRILTACISRRHDHDVQFYAFDILVSDGEDVGKLPLSMCKPRPGAVTGAAGSATSSKARSARTCFAMPV
jgi:hypothetical protein